MSGRRQGQRAVVRERANGAARNGGEPDGLERSLASTRQGLATLLESLRASGLEAAARPYADMQLVLLQQRLWCRNNGREDLDPYFADIAASARAIHRILTAFDAAIARLARVDRLGPSGQPSAPPASSAELAAVLLEEGVVSNARLAARLDWPEDDRRRFLRSLVEAGVLERRGWGRGLSYRLSDAVRRRAADEVAELLRA